MLYPIGTMQDLTAIRTKLPAQVYAVMLTEISALDAAYGAGRDFSQIGGYILLVESAADLPVLREIIPYETHPCEWAIKEPQNSGYIHALYIMNNDFAISVYLPFAAAPENILKDLEEQL